MGFTKYLLKNTIKHNPIDPLFSSYRRFMTRIGRLDHFDDVWYTQFAMRTFWKIFKKFCGGKFYWTDTSSTPLTGPLLYVSNHSHLLDPFIVATPIPRIIQWVSKAENFETPIFKTICNGFRTIPLRRGERDEKAIQMINSVLAKGGCVGMFPEGTRTKNGEIQRFHTGASRICLENKVPYVPLACKGSYKFKFGKKMTVYVGEPIYIDPSIELNYKNARFIADEMEKDVRNLKAGIKVKSRIITLPGQKPTISLPTEESVKNMKEHIQKTVSIPTKNEISVLD